MFELELLFVELAPLLDQIDVTSCGHFILQPAGAARPAPGGMSGMPKRSPAPRPAPAAARPPPRLNLSTLSPFSEDNL